MQILNVAAVAIWLDFNKSALRNYRWRQKQ
jgi:hypothetical protein